MFSIFILLIIVIGLVTTIGFSILALIQNGEKALSIQKTQAQVEILSKVITSQIRQKNGYILVPVEVGLMKDDEETDTVKREEARWIIEREVPMFAPYKTTASGAKMTYCPVGASNSTNALTTTTTEHVSTENRFEVYEADDGQQYVVSGKGWLKNEIAIKARRLHMVALILVPGPQANQADDLLNCKDVETEDEMDHMLIAGGSVTPIYAVNSGNTFIVANDKDQLAAALWKIDFEKPYASTIVLGSNIIEDGDSIRQALDHVASNLSGRTLTIQGSSNSIIGLTGDPIRVSGRLTLLDMDILHPITSTQSGELFISNTITGSLHAFGGSVHIGEDSGISTTNNEIPIRITGGDVQIANSVVLGHEEASKIIAMEGGRLHINGEPTVIGNSDTIVLDNIGHGTVTGTENVVTVKINWGTGTEQIYPIEPIKETQTCSGYSCVATCPSQRRIINGYCQSSEASLIGYSINDEMSAFTCNWSSPVLTSEAVALCR